MKKWYKQSYFNRKNWILENFDKLSLTNDETMLLLVIELAKDNKRVVNYDYLKSKLGLNEKGIDNIVASLVNKKFLSITPTSSGVKFDIDAIFEFDPDKYDVIDAKDVYQSYEEIISRPLNSTELQKLSDALNEYGQDKVIDAIRQADAYRKTSIAYVESILKNEKDK